jgi:DNA-binding MltR family transcriptional regulator
MAKKKTKSAEEIAMSTIDEEFQGASDRHVAIVGGAYLDALLESLLRSVFNEQDEEDLLGTSGPLSSNGSRYKLAYRLGLIRKHQRDDLDMSQRFAMSSLHIHTSLSFDDAPISDWWQ